jgi:hypothetical protein
MPTSAFALDGQAPGQWLFGGFIIEPLDDGLLHGQPTPKLSKSLWTSSDSVCPHDAHTTYILRVGTVSNAHCIHLNT